ncbi:MAG: sensor histidine kinase, partial [Hyphomonadaceae bacterium]
MRILNRRSLATRLVAAAAAWCLLVLALAGWGLSELYRQSALRGLDGDLQVVLRTLAATVTPAADGVALSQSPNDPRFGQTFSGRYWQVRSE